jgi:hypothetical protein
MASTVDERVLLVPMSRLASNHIDKDKCCSGRFLPVCHVAMGYDTIDHGLWECKLHCALINELQ